MRSFALNYIETNPCFYIEELQPELRLKFANVPASASTICRALRFDLAMTRKVLTKRARTIRLRLPIGALLPVSRPVGVHQRNSQGQPSVQPPLRVVSSQPTGRGVGAICARRARLCVGCYGRQRLPVLGADSRGVFKKASSPRVLHQDPTIPSPVAAIEGDCGFG